MKRINLFAWLVSGTLLLAIGAIWLLYAPSAPAVTGESRRLIPTPVGGQPWPTQAGPTSTMPPPNATASALTHLRTVVAQGRIQRGAIALLTPTPTPTPLVIPQPTVAGLPSVAIAAATAGATIPVGGVGSASFLTARSTRYLVFAVGCYPICHTAAITQSGVYAYDLQAQTFVQVGPGERKQWHPEIGGDWVIYIGEDTDSAVLRAQNLATGERLLITDAFDYTDPTTNQPASIPASRYATDGTVVVWADKGIHMYTLATQVVSTLPLPPGIGEQAVGLDVAAPLVIWQGYHGYWGYDLEYQELFALDVLPPGWENVQGTRFAPLTIEGDHLFWSYLVNGQEYSFTAPIVRSP